MPLRERTPDHTQAIVRRQNLGPVDAMVFHQGSVIGRDVGGEARPGWNELEEVVLLFRG
jgi:hypothetical protein